MLLRTVSLIIPKPLHKNPSAKQPEFNSGRSAEGAGPSDRWGAVLIGPHIWEVDKGKIHICIPTRELLGGEDEYGFPLGGE